MSLEEGEANRLIAKKTRERNTKNVVTLLAVIFVAACLITAISIIIIITTSKMGNKRLDRAVEVQGHRGCRFYLHRGLLPENTIPAYIKAIDLGVDTLEMDTVISKDKQVVMSHEPWLNSEYCTGPNGESINSEDVAIKNFTIYHMNYADVGKSNCGHRNSHFPTQTHFPIAKPLLSDVFDAVETYIANNNKRKLWYNIETKSRPERDGVMTPPIQEFCELLYNVIKSKNMTSRVTIQSFDVRSLIIFKKLDPSLPLSLLVEWNEQAPFNFKDKLNELGFNPDIYSPQYKLLTPEILSYMKSENIRTVPWTINTYDDMKRIVDMGVEGIITDFPNLATSFMKHPGH
ncbi:lysophospholipase D [Acrasis kona]|uniref:Lysophospholipase D n=1 Tax=Acrasis kona TaxID=1008807 RepID=A0AAW2YM52_9EUKA